MHDWDIGGIIVASSALAAEEEERQQAMEDEPECLECGALLSLGDGHEPGCIEDES